MPRMDSDDASEILSRCNLQARPDFFTLPAATVESLLAHADAVKYRKPKNANGSRGRYFYAYVCRAAAADK